MYSHRVTRSPKKRRQESCRLSAGRIYHIDEGQDKLGVCPDNRIKRIVDGNEASADRRSWRQRLEDAARRAKRDGVALYLAARDPRVSWAVKGLAVLVAAYVLSPIDLIPDFIPVLGLLDELILLPIAVLLIARLIDPALMAEFRARAEALDERPRSRTGIVLVALVWSAVAMALVWVFWPKG